ncbi:MAG: polar amino acid transport system substrate-binding protein [Colwellia sp.]|jgi:polar amino acid transport system substrate-binding protein
MSKKSSKIKSNYFLRYLIPLLIPSIVYSSASVSKTIRIAAIDWCPQVCINQPIEGYTVELIRKVFEESDFELVIDIYPWSRAIKYVTNGEYDALLSPAKKRSS